MELDGYGEVFNVGSGEGVAIEAIADLISEDQHHSEGRPGELLHSRASIAKIQQQLGWEPSVQVLDWLRRQL